METQFIYNYSEGFARGNSSLGPTKPSMDLDKELHLNSHSSIDDTRDCVYRHRMRFEAGKEAGVDLPLDRHLLLADASNRRPAGVVPSQNMNNSSPFNSHKTSQERPRSHMGETEHNQSSDSGLNDSANSLDMSEGPGAGSDDDITKQDDDEDIRISSNDDDDGLKSYEMMSDSEEVDRSLKKGHQTGTGSKGRILVCSCC